MISQLKTAPAGPPTVKDSPAFFCIKTTVAHNRDDGVDYRYQMSHSSIKNLLCLQHKSQELFSVMFQGYACEANP
jgi:hypothetical protein